MAIHKVLYTILFSLGLALTTYGQDSQCYIEKGMVFFNLKLHQSDSDLVRVCSKLDISPTFVDSLRRGDVRAGIQTKAWTVHSIDPVFVVVKMPLDKFGGNTKGLEAEEKSIFGLFDLFMVEDKVVNDIYPEFRNNLYGYNRFSGNYQPVKDKHVVLELPGHTEARDVYIAGTFNEWNFYKHKMKRTLTGWEIEISLRPGRHLYKFVVDGHWMLDPRNPSREMDYGGNENNVLFVPNYRFETDSFPQARSVYVASSFNDWHERSLPLRKSGGRWALDLFIPQGTHAYKYIVDGEWTLDPDNPHVRQSEEGYKNNYLAVGDSFNFELPGYTQAKKVVVCGDFNAWQENELQMEKVQEGWQLGYVLAPGQYQYKYIVDGQWILDPLNMYEAKMKDERNSLLCVKPNQRFSFPHSAGVEDVRITGSFTGWDEYGFTLVKQGDEWVIDLYLYPGKCLYKFIVNGEWVLDPSNPLWEQNEYGTGNSVLWRSAY